MKKRLLSFLCLAAICFSTQSVFAQSGDALTFNGTTQYATIPHHADFNVSTTGDFTITMWVKASRFINTNGGEQRFLSKRNSTGSNMSGYELWGAKSSSQFYANNAPGTDGTHVNSMSVWGTTPGSLNTWQHIAFVVDHTNGKMYLYQNGVQTGNNGTKNIAPWEVTNPYDIFLGCWQSGTTKACYLQGSIDNLRFYKKALTTAEIGTDKGSNTYLAESNIIAAYDFESLDGAILTDVSGNGHNGALYNYPVSGPVKISAATLEQCPYYTGRGNDNEWIVKSAVTAAGVSAATLTSLTLSMDGTTSVNDVEEIKVYRTTTAVYDFRNLTGATLLATASPAEGDIVCPITGTLSAGTHYLWVTYKVKEGAKEGNQLDATIKSITTSSQTYTYAAASPAGSRTILLARKLLFAPGDNGSTNYRIPAIITAKDGSLVALTDKRKFNKNDLAADIDVLANRSIDGGKTWSAPVTVALGTSTSAGFGDASVCQTGEPGGLIAVFVGGNGLFASSPTNPIRTYTSKSLDNGITWGTPVDITSQLFGASCPDATRRSWYGSFCASGRGLLTRSGRLMFVASVRENSGNSLANYVYYSDDNGVTWKVSGRATTGGDESHVVELNNGDILMSTRNLTFGARRKVISTDGGLTWAAPSTWPELQVPNCNGDIIRYTSTKDGYDKDRLLQILPYNSNIRKNGSAMLSYDEGATWSIIKTIAPDVAGYSSVTILPDGTIGVYFEEGNPQAAEYDMQFLNFSLAWLTDGADEYVAPGIEAAKEPAFSVPGGIYEAYQSLVLSSETTGASIYYTLDGSVPSSSSTLYSEPIALDTYKTYVVKAIAVKEGMSNSTISSSTYTLLDPERPIEYCIPTGSTTAAPGSNRYLASIKTTDGITNLDFASTSQSVYVKVPETNLTTIMQGTSFTLQWVASTSNNNIKWTHAELFIDWDGNGIFDGTCDSPTQEAYAKIGFDHNDTNAPSNFVTVGNVAIQNYSTKITMPAGTTSGKKCVRVKFTDAWHSKNSGEMGQHGACKSVDQGIIYDFTLLVESATPYAVTYVQPTEGGTFAIKNGEAVVASGAEISSHTLLTIETLPAAGYQVKQILINGVANTGNTFIMPTKATTVEVVFTDEIKLIHTSTGTGSLRIADASDNTLATDSWLPTGSIVTLISTPNAGSELYTLLQNGTDIASSLVENRTTVTLTENTTFATTYGVISYPFTYSITPASMGTLTIKKGITPITSGDRLDYGDVLTATVDLINPLAVVKSIDLNGTKLPNATSFTVEITQASLLTVELEVPTYTLTYSIAGGGAMKVTYVADMDTPLNSGDVINKGEEIYLKYTPDAGESLVSSILNGTIDIVASDYYSEGEAWIPIDGDMAIVTSFSSTGIGNTEADQAAIYVVDGVIYGSEDFIVYNFASQVVAAGKAGQGVSGLAAGTYIVRAGATVKKVIL